MKTLIIAFVLLLSSNIFAAIDQDNYVTFIQENGFWAVLQDSKKLVFCFGVDKNGAPVCTSVPKQYLVIELPSNLQ